MKKAKAKLGILVFDIFAQNWETQYEFTEKKVWSELFDKYTTFASSLFSRLGRRCQVSSAEACLQHKV
jgi:hypothetical protein